MRTRNGLIALVVGVALVAAGCGSDDDESSTTAAEALTKEEFITQADQICAEGDAEINSAAQQEFSAGQPTEEETTAFVEDTVIPNVQAQRVAIGALGAPEGDEEAISSLLDELDQAIAEVSADPSAAVAEGAGDPFADVNAQASEYGLTDCGDG